MVVLTSFTQPTDGIRHRQNNTTVYVNDNNLGKGTLFIAESRLSWVSDGGNGFSIEYPHISLHAVSRDLSAFPQECLFLMLDTAVGDEETSNGNGENEDGDENGSDEETTEIRLVPDDRGMLEAMFHAMNACQALHPDPEDSFSDEDFFEDADDEIPMEETDHRMAGLRIESMDVRPHMGRGVEDMEGEVEDMEEEVEEEVEDMEEDIEEEEEEEVVVGRVVGMGVGMAVGVEVGVGVGVGVVEGTSDTSGPWALEGVVGGRAVDMEAGKVGVAGDMVGEDIYTSGAGVDMEAGKVVGVAGDMGEGGIYTSGVEAGRAVGVVGGKVAGKVGGVEAGKVGVVVGDMGEGDIYTSGVEAGRAVGVVGGKVAGKVGGVEAGKVVGVAGDKGEEDICTWGVEADRAVGVEEGKVVGVEAGKVVGVAADKEEEDICTWGVEADRAVGVEEGKVVGVEAGKVVGVEVGKVVEVAAVAEVAGGMAGVDICTSAPGVIYHRVLGGRPSSSGSNWRQDMTVLPLSALSPRMDLQDPRHFDDAEN